MRNGNSLERLCAVALAMAAGVVVTAACSKENKVNVNDNGGGAGTSGIPDLPDCTAEAGTPPGDDMVVAGRLDGTCFWLDKTEVTREKYEAFVASAGAPDQLTPCEWNTTFAPDTACDEQENVTRDGSHPIVCVDWCDAMAYCESIGKTLCDGEQPSPDDAYSSSWYSACSDGTKRRYPYGDAYQPEVCNGDGESTTTAAVGTWSSCKAASGALDMSGNVAEWVDECNKTAGEGDQCNLRGGSFLMDSDQLQCAKVTQPTRATTRRDIGFRCCAYD